MAAFPRTLFIATALCSAVGLVWWSQLPRSADDCTPSDAQCMRQLASSLLAQKLAETAYDEFISDEIDRGGRLLATQGYRDPAAMHQDARDIGFQENNLGAIDRVYFSALDAPATPLDYAQPMVDHTAPGGADLNAYLSAAIGFAIDDPATRGAALAVWEQHARDLPHAAEETKSQVYLWAAQNDLAFLTRAAGFDPGWHRDYDGRAVAPFLIAAHHCASGRIAEGRALVTIMEPFFGTDPGPKPGSPFTLAMLLPTLLDCEGEQQALALIDRAIADLRTHELPYLNDIDERKRRFGLNGIEAVSNSIRDSVPSWLTRHGRADEARAFWLAYAPDQIAARAFPDLPWVVDHFRANQSSYVPDRFSTHDSRSPVREHRLAYWAASDVVPVAKLSIWADIAAVWPDPQAITTARRLLQVSASPTSYEGLLVRAFVARLDRRMGCTASEANLTEILHGASTLETLQQVDILIEMIRYSEIPTGAPVAGYTCIGPLAVD